MLNLASEVSTDSELKQGENSRKIVPPRRGPL
jgi:hypothetical protein